MRSAQRLPSAVPGLAGTAERPTLSGTGGRVFLFHHIDQRHLYKEGVPPEDGFSSIHHALLLNRSLMSPLWTEEL